MVVCWGMYVIGFFSLLCPGKFATDSQMLGQHWQLQKFWLLKKSSVCIVKPRFSLIFFLPSLLFLLDERPKTAASYFGFGLCVFCQLYHRVNVVSLPGKLHWTLPFWWCLCFRVNPNEKDVLMLWLPGNYNVTLAPAGMPLGVSVPGRPEFAASCTSVWWNCSPVNTVGFLSDCRSFQFHLIQWDWCKQLRKCCTWNPIR